jgi:hypothetical protein
MAAPWMPTRSLIEVIYFRPKTNDCSQITFLKEDSYLLCLCGMGEELEELLKENYGTDGPAPIVYGTMKTLTAKSVARLDFRLRFTSTAATSAGVVDASGI